MGGDKDVPEAKDVGMHGCGAEKTALTGHRDLLGYTTRAAPKGQNYLFVRKGDHAAMNLIDTDDPELFPKKCFSEGIRFTQEMWSEGKKILVHCNAGHSRGPTMAMLFLRSIGELPQPFNRAEKIFHTLYPPYDPGHGMEFWARKLWDKIVPKEQHV